MGGRTGTDRSRDSARTGRQRPMQLHRSRRAGRAERVGGAPAGAPARTAGRDPRLRGARRRQRTRPAADRADLADPDRPGRAGRLSAAPTAPSADRGVLLGRGRRVLHPGGAGRRPLALEDLLPRSASPRTSRPARPWCCPRPTRRAPRACEALFAPLVRFFWADRSNGLLPSGNGSASMSFRQVLPCREALSAATATADPVESTMTLPVRTLLRRSMSLLSVGAMTVLLTAFAGTQAQGDVPPPPSGWSTVFSDDFSGPAGSGAAPSGSTTPGPVPASAPARSRR